jgi:hypothetical protein
MYNILPPISNNEGSPIPGISNCSYYLILQSENINIVWRITPEYVINDIWHKLDGKMDRPSVKYTVMVMRPQVVY